MGETYAACSGRSSTPSTDYWTPSGGICVLGLTKKGVTVVVRLGGSVRPEMRPDEKSPDSVGSRRVRFHKMVDSMVADAWSSSS